MRLQLLDMAGAEMKGDLLICVGNRQTFDHGCCPLYREIAARLYLLYYGNRIFGFDNSRICGCNHGNRRVG